MKRIALLLLIAVLGIIMLYLSRFWFLDLWPRSGLFGWEVLRPGGGLLGRWLRGTPFAPFELLIWSTSVFLILTYLQRFIDFILPTPAPEKDDNHEN
jgi:hypothetical protein